MSPSVVFTTNEFVTSTAVHDSATQFNRPLIFIYAVFNVPLYTFIALAPVVERVPSDTSVVGLDTDTLAILLSICVFCVQQPLLRHC